MIQTLTYAPYQQVYDIKISQGKKKILHQLTQTLLTGFLNPILNFQIKNPNEITDVYI